MCKYTDKDLTKVKQIIMGEKKPTIFDFVRYDINRDGKINSLDYQMIKAKMGVITK